MIDGQSANRLNLQDAEPNILLLRSGQSQYMLGTLSLETAHENPQGLRGFLPRYSCPSSGSAASTSFSSSSASKTTASASTSSSSSSSDANDTTGTSGTSD